MSILERQLKKKSIELLEPQLKNTLKKLKLLEMQQEMNKKSVGQIFDVGLPPLSLDWMMSYPRCWKTPDSAVVEIRNFPIIHDVDDIVDRRPLAAIFSHVVDGVLRPQGEFDLRTYVFVVIQELLIAVNLQRIFSISSEITLETLMPDILVLRHVKECDQPVCCILIKNPLSKDLEARQSIAELLDQMLRLRVLHGRNEVFGIITTYTGWRIAWFSYMDEVVSSTSSTYPPAVETPIVAADYRLCCTDVIPYNDTRLPRMLVTMLCKAAHSRHVALPLSGVNRLYNCVSEKTSTWECSHIESLSLLPPPTTTSTTTHDGHTSTHFKLLEDFHEASDCRLWLACNEAGNLVFLKFITPYKGDYTMTMTSARKKFVKLLGHAVVVTPFSFACRYCIDNDSNGSSNSVKDPSFVPSLSYYHRYEHLYGVKYLKEHETATRMLSELTPQILARQAIDTMIASGYYRKNMYWSQIAALPVLSTTTTDDGSETRTLTGFRGIVYDFANVYSLKKERMNAETARSNMLLELGLDS
eukprot:gene10367-21629_t